MVFIIIEETAAQFIHQVSRYLGMTALNVSKVTILKTVSYRYASVKQRVNRGLSLIHI